MTEHNLDRAARILSASRHVIALTGAGISVESGIPDFRSPGGLWERFDPMVYATIDTFRQDPQRCWELFAEVDRVLAAARPNAAHEALATLERWGVLRALITQNIDGLHRRAGSRAVREYHGTHGELHCIECGRRWRRDAAPGGAPPRCGCGQVLKPAVVLFGEPIPHEVARQAEADAARADAIIVVGTSATVFPVAAIPRVVARRGHPVIEVNVAPTSLTREVDTLLLSGPAGVVLPRLTERVGERLAAGPLDTGRYSRQHSGDLEDFPG